jgi:hypothetical protein
MPLRKPKSAAEELVDEHKRETSRIGRLRRWALIKLGFSQCRYCVYCEAEGDKYRGMRESIMLNRGKCHWSGDSITANLDRDDLRKYHRCPAFTPVLYNFKDYAINPNEVNNIYSRRKETFFAWMGWIVAILIAIFSVLLKNDI